MPLFNSLAAVAYLASFVVLLRTITNSRSCAGISLKSQVLYLVLLICRYLDVVTVVISPFNTTMKLLLVSSSAAVVAVMRLHPTVRATYRPASDELPLCWVLLPAAALSLLVTGDLWGQLHGAFHYGIAGRGAVLKVAWAFSHFLSAVAMLPQLGVLRRERDVAQLPGSYVGLLGMYRAADSINWMHRWMTEPWYRFRRDNLLVWVCGTSHTLVYCVFLHAYLTIKSQAASGHERDLGLEPLLAAGEAEGGEARRNAQQAAARSRA